MRIERVELVRASLPLVTPFRTSFGTELDRDALLVHVVGDGAEGWGECVAMTEPVYSSEYVDGAIDVLRRFFVPQLRALGDLTAGDVAPALAHLHGHRMAKGALEMAVLDAELRGQGRSFGEELGAVRDRVACGVSVGIMDSIPDLLAAVAGYVEDGYVRIKLKIEPGWDLEPVRAVRELIGDLPLQVDANTAYGRGDVDHLRGLDAFDLLLIEQPYDEEDLLGHALLASAIQTPVCLDESVLDARSAITAIEMGACSIVNIKPGRVGGYLEAKRVHDACLERGVAVWCGGMVETGLGRAANIALAALPGFSLPGDTSSASRFFAHDIITEELLVVDGQMSVPTGPGLGVTLDTDALDAVVTWRAWLD